MLLRFARNPIAFELLPDTFCQFSSRLQAAGKRTFPTPAAIPFCIYDLAMPRPRAPRGQSGILHVAK